MEPTARSIHVRSTTVQTPPWFTRTATSDQTDVEVEIGELLYTTVTLPNGDQIRAQYDPGAQVNLDEVRLDKAVVRRR